MKSLILAGGRGKRLEYITKDINKCLLEYNKIPIIEYNLNRAIDLNVNEIIIVVGYRAEDIINKYGNLFKNTKIKYVFQKEQKGLVNAIECAKDAIGQEDFFLLLADEILINSKHKEMTNLFDENTFAICGICKRDEQNKNKIHKTYGVLTTESGSVLRLIEKPKVILNDIQGTGHILFKNEILSYINETPIHYLRHEKELPDLIQCAIDNGKNIKIYNICDEYININTEEELEEIQI